MPSLYLGGFTCVPNWVLVHIYPIGLVWRSENNLEEEVFSLPSLRTLTQIIRFGSKHLYPVKTSHRLKIFQLIFERD